MAERILVINPNSTKLVTGWDVAGFTGPWSWEEEEARRTYIKTIAWVDVQPLRPTRRT